MTSARCILFFLVLPSLLLQGCRVHYVSPCRKPPVSIPEQFNYEDENGEGLLSEWWKEFEQQELNRVVGRALLDNLDIKQSWSRLSQARAALCIAGSAKVPSVDLETSTEFKDEIRSGGSDLIGMTYLVKPALSYEIDLWRRIDSKVRAAWYDAQTSVEDLEAAALLLTGSVTESWFTIQEQKALKRLIEHQIEVSGTLLELVELHFSTGSASALDVYQQRLQYEETKATLIPVRERLQTAIHQLNTLLGQTPEEGVVLEPGPERIELPPFPDMGTPMQLLCRRPDLRSAYNKLIAADYQVAAAVADCFPKLTLPTSYEFKSGSLTDLFTSSIFRIALKAVTPIFDGSRRRCEVKRQQAIVCERLYSFGQRFLTALREVEDAVVTEKLQIELIEQLNKEVEIAKRNLEEARQRNSLGLNDYLTVISAIQSLQRLERRVISEQKKLLSNRAKLYRALGAPCLVRCEDRCEEEEYCES